MGLKVECLREKSPGYVVKVTVQVEAIPFS